jgi:hypothetical protein
MCATVGIELGSGRQFMNWTKALSGNAIVFNAAEGRDFL